MHPEVEKWVAEFVQKCHNHAIENDDLCHHLVCLGVDIPDAADPDSKPVSDVEKSFAENLGRINSMAWHAIKNSGRMEGMNKIFSGEMARKQEDRQIIGCTAFGRRLLTLFSPIPNRRWFMKAPAIPKRFR